jgi:hypothetical protein
MFMEAASAMARQVLTESATDEDRLINVFRRCLTRPPAADELPMLQRFLEEQRERQLDDELLWTTVSRALMNLDEAITHP